jgi:hypothetical protein
MYGWVETKLHAFLTLALDKGEWFFMPQGLSHRKETTRKNSRAGLDQWWKDKSLPSGTEPKSSGLLPVTILAKLLQLFFYSRELIISGMSGLFNLSTINIS